MKNILYVLFFVVLSPLGQAESLDAHVHGVVNIDIAVEKKELLIMLKTPAESFLGFEYKAKTAKEKLKVEKVKKEWLGNLKKYLGELALKNCSQSSSKWNQKFMGEHHSQIEAEAHFKCKDNLAGKELSLSFGNFYSRIESIHLQMILDSGKIISQKTDKNIIRIKL